MRYVSLYTDDIDRYVSLNARLGKMRKSKEVTCLHCGKILGTENNHGWFVWRDDGRTDKQFCDTKCTAAYHRENDHPILHADLPRNIHFDCEVCGNLVKINEYADRTGKRRALYCSNKCKQKAYRERKKSEHAQNVSGADKEIRNATVWVCQTPECGQKRFFEPMGDICDYCGGSDWRGSLSF